MIFLWNTWNTLKYSTFEVTLAYNETLVVRMRCFEYFENIWEICWSLKRFEYFEIFHFSRWRWLIMKFWRFEWWGWKWVMKGINPAPSLNLNESYIFQYFHSIFKIIVVHFSIFSLNLQNNCSTFFNIFIQSLKKLFIFQYFQSSNWVLYIFQYFHSITKRCLWFSSSMFSFKLQNNLIFSQHFHSIFKIM